MNPNVWHRRSLGIFEHFNILLFQYCNFVMHIMTTDLGVKPFFLNIFIDFFLLLTNKKPFLTTVEPSLATTCKRWPASGTTIVFLYFWPVFRNHLHNAIGTMIFLDRTALWTCFRRHFFHVSSIFLEIFYHNIVGRGYLSKRQGFNTDAMTDCWSKQCIDDTLWQREAWQVKRGRRERVLFWSFIVLIRCYDWPMVKIMQWSSNDPAKGDHLPMTITFVRQNWWSP